MYVVEEKSSVALCVQMGCVETHGTMDINLGLRSVLYTGSVSLVSLMETKTQLPDQ
jgi:hypothetical protein